RFVSRQAVPARSTGGGDQADARKRQGEHREGQEVRMPESEKAKKSAARKQGPAAKKSAKGAARPPARVEPPDGEGDQPAARQGDARGKYVYCIIESSETLRFGPLGIGADPADVHTINYKDIAAVVSDTPIEVHDPTRENVLAHERVNRSEERRGGEEGRGGGG